MAGRGRTRFPSPRNEFGTVLEEFPSLQNRLSSRADLLEDPDFESAIFTLQSGKGSQLNIFEKRAVINLTESPVSEATVNDETKLLCLAHRARKKLLISQSATDLGYLDASFLLPMSTICERLFSKAGYAESDGRNGISPSNFESQLFLHVNKQFWDLPKVSQLLK